MPVSSRASTVASATTESERPESCGQDKQSKGNNMNHHVEMVEQVRLCTKTDLII